MPDERAATTRATVEEELRPAAEQAETTLREKAERQRHFFATSWASGGGSFR